MAKLDLSKYGITGTTEIVYNPSYEQLFDEETKPELEGYEKGHVSELGAVNVMTGIYTGRSPKDKFIVMDENSKDTVWWTSDEYKNDNHPASQEAWEAVKEIAKKELSNKRPKHCRCKARRFSRCVRWILSCRAGSWIITVCRDGVISTISITSRFSTTERFGRKIAPPAEIPRLIPRYGFAGNSFGKEAVVMSFCLF